VSTWLALLGRAPPKAEGSAPAPQGRSTGTRWEYLGVEIKSAVQFEVYSLVVLQSKHIHEHLERHRRHGEHLGRLLHVVHQLVICS
jgi:hypothetical protein